MTESSQKFRRHIDRMQSAPPDESYALLPESSKNSSAFNLNANEFVPGGTPSASEPKPLTSESKTKLSISAMEFNPLAKPSVPLPASAFRADAPEFTLKFGPTSSMQTLSLNAAVNVPEFIPGGQFKLEEQPAKVEEKAPEPPKIEEEIVEPEDKFTLVFNRALVEQEIAEEVDFADVAIKVDERIIYTYEEIERIGKEIENESEYSKITAELSQLSDRKIFKSSRKRDNKRHDSKKGQRKDKEWREKEQQGQTLTIVNWRREKTTEEEKIIQKAREHTAKLKENKEEEEKIKRTIKVTLNKLSPSNLEKLRDQLMDIGKSSPSSLQILVAGIFDKAWSEPKYTQMYAQMCGHFKVAFESHKFPGLEEEKTPKNPFKNELLIMCEESFKFVPSETDYEGLDEEAAEKKKVLHKKKTQGNVRFIGELFNVKLITTKIVLMCIHEMLGLDEGSQGRPQTLDEDKLEGACILLSTGGAGFERGSLKKETNKVFEYLSSLIQNKTTLSSKLRFKIMNLVDERNSGWSKNKKDEPTTIEEVHAEFEKEQSIIQQRHEVRR
ncbi:unnamed protein product [Blepharisma stoltei]|uniref:MIF4G domain-containing protein n=1 Tax=Blepharisma stoltei TaxID=1481888 RepID=A0AAU9JK82_9CILI|nr:unnamed protein product [Blepharisma stoltei]